MKIVDIWTLDDLCQSRDNPAEEEMRLLNLQATRAIKYAVRRL
jgi:hypothetical protein